MQKQITKHPPAPPLRLPNGFGSISLLSGNRRRPYVARVSIEKLGTGKYKQQYLGVYESWYEAYNALINHHASMRPINQSTKYPTLIGQAKPITLWDVYTLWKDDPVTKIELGESIRKNYHGAISTSPEFHNLVITEVTCSQLTDMLYKSNHAPTMKRVLCTILRKLFRYAVQKDMLMINPAAELTVKVKHIPKRRTTFTIAEIKKVMHSPQCRERDITIILLFTGMRPGELFDLKEENIFYDKRYMVAGKKTSAGINRVIPIHKEIEPVLRRLCATPNGFLNEIRPLRRYEHLAKYIKRIGVKHIPYECRHTFISRAQVLGMQEICLKKMIGHHGNVTEFSYTHLPDESLVDAIDAFYY